MMGTLTEVREFIEANAIDAEENNVHFFGVGAKEGASADKLKELLVDTIDGEFGVSLNLFDGEEHNYLQVGAWIGDQALALRLIGLGSELGLWKLLTPKTVLGDLIPDDLADTMAGRGFISLQYQEAT